jgi:two-component system, LytTR family, response regulator
MSIESGSSEGQAMRTIIVDDEPLARRGIELRLAEHADVQVIGECENAREAITMINELAPDLMFLDIQMPGVSGLELLAQVPQTSLPMVIMVTAFDRYAVEAFEAQALDYLLKPLGEPRFSQALERARQARAQRSALVQREKLMSLLARVQGSGALDEQLLRDHLQRTPAQQFADILPIRDDADTVRVPVATIDWIDAAGDYMCVHAAGRTYVLRETMKSLEAILDPKVFQRVHRSTIVNLQRVRRLRPHTNGEYFLMLEDGQEIKLSRSYRNRVDQLLKRR